MDDWLGRSNQWLDCWMTWLRVLGGIVMGCGVGLLTTYTPRLSIHPCIHAPVIMQGEEVRTEDEYQVAVQMVGERRLADIVSYCTQVRMWEHKRCWACRMRCSAVYDPFGSRGRKIPPPS